MIENVIHDPFCGEGESGARQRYIAAVVTTSLLLAALNGSAASDSVSRSVDVDSCSPQALPLFDRHAAAP